MTNRKSKILADRKDRQLSLIQFDIAGPFPKSLRGNRYFLLIIDSFLRKNWILLLKQKSDAIQCLRTFKATVEREVNEKIKAARSDNAPELLLTVEGWREQDGIEAQSTVVASSHQNGAAERNIRTAEADMRSMLKESNLPIEFWDEAVEADAYMRNRIATGPIISDCVTSPQEAWTNKRPTIDHIKIWGSKCYSYVNPLTIPPGMRKDKLVDQGRTGVFMGYSNTTDKQFKVYSPELGYTNRVSVIKVDESIRGGTIDLRLRNCASGPQDSIPKENLSKVIPPDNVSIVNDQILAHKNDILPSNDKDVPLQVDKINTLTAKNNLTSVPNDYLPLDDTPLPNETLPHNDNLYPNDTPSSKNNSHYNDKLHLNDNSHHNDNTHLSDNSFDGKINNDPLSETRNADEFTQINDFSDQNQSQILQSQIIKIGADKIKKTKNKPKKCKSKSENSSKESKEINLAETINCASGHMQPELTEQSAEREISEPTQSQGNKLPEPIAP
ncbi:hypothetical protein K3495_g13407, partial [Podosphaera aphanis]